jgi:hypothetical protein
MNDPIKIIHKYKNNHRRVQYRVYVFIGDLVEPECLRVLQKIQNWDLERAWTQLDARERSILENFYGEFWYEKIYLSHHIRNIQERILKDPSKMEEILEIYGRSWTEKHIREYRKRLQVVTYRYEYMVKDQLEKRMSKKMLKQQQQEIIEQIDFTTLKGGQNEFDPEDLENERRLAELEDEEQSVSFEDVEKYYAELDEVDQNLKKTTHDIKNIISDDVYRNIVSQILEFDTSKNESLLDEKLEDVYQKSYVTGQYIFKDDTIRNMRNKITCSFKNDPKFGQDAYIIPSYQYFWSEYYFEGRIEKIMIGQKFTVRNMLLKLDVEPNNNLGIYEELRGNLRLLRDNIHRHGKIKKEDDDYNILYDYEGYYTCNEIFMIDIYNELGLDYHPSPEELRNLLDVYFRIYFIGIRPEDVQNIIDFLDTRLPESRKTMERNRLKSIFETVQNDLILENQVVHTVEELPKRVPEYHQIFQENYITQTVVRTYLLGKMERLDLFRIFDNFMLNDVYPFVQYQPVEGAPRYRYHERYLLESGKKEMIMKWFETSPYGLSFKVKFSGQSSAEIRYIAVNLNETGRIDYKIQWKEEDHATSRDIETTYDIIRSLIGKINQENRSYGIKLHIPKNQEFKFAFINSIQKFELPEKFVVNHNDLSEFARYFFPYVALVVEPRKRKGRSLLVQDEKGKFGTYLRYKRVSKYENRSRIEYRILYFMRNYEYNEESLINEISKDFNITEEQAAQEIQRVREKYPGVKKSRKILKKMENIPKYKPPGTGIDIQGKTRQNYKIRIAGAKDWGQLARIIRFVNIFIYLYLEIYLYRLPEKQYIRDQLRRLTRVARRRNKVEEVVDYEESTKTVKQMTRIDSKRLKYRADETQNQWTRNCQNSGEDKLRRPQQYINEADLIARGYSWREKLDDIPYGHYAREVWVDEDGRVDSGKKKHHVVLRAVRLPLDDGRFVYYTCNPEENGKHMFIGFLTKAKTPMGDLAPCCFIKDQFYSKNPEKRNIYLQGIGIGQAIQAPMTMGSQLYILQDSNKIQEGRFAFLPKDLDIFFNISLGHERIIRNHYLISSRTGYFFKYGVQQSPQDEYHFLSSICALYDMGVEELRKRMVHFLENDKDLRTFTSLNNGDLRNQFGDLETYLNYLRYNNYPEHRLLGDLLCMPGILYEHGTNLIIFERRTGENKQDEQIYVLCQNVEDLENLKDPERATIFLIREGKIYFPIVQVVKTQRQTGERVVQINRAFHYAAETQNIVNHLLEYYTLNCRSEYSILVKDPWGQGETAKIAYRILLKNGYHVRRQYLDARFKCRYLVTQEGYLVPVLPSGSIYHLPHIDRLARYLHSFDQTYEHLIKLSQMGLHTKPLGITYNKQEDGHYWANALLTQNYSEVPITPEKISPDRIKGLDLVTVKQEVNLDQEIARGQNNTPVDRRILALSKYSYETELYQLFRFHLSYYLNQVDLKLREHIMQQILGNYPDKRKNIKKMLYEASDQRLYQTFLELLRRRAQTAGAEEKQAEKSVQIVPDFPETDAHTIVHSHPPELPRVRLPSGWIRILPRDHAINYPEYHIQNIRELCYLQDKDACQKRYHCSWDPRDKICLLSVREDNFIEYINRVVEELVENGLRAQEILRVGNYFVSDIVSYQVYTERPYERLVIASAVNLNKVLAEVFGKENLPRVGRRKKIDRLEKDYIELNAQNPLREDHKWYYQTVLEHNNSLYRAFANCYYWTTHPYSAVEYRNLGYYSTLQTILANIYKAQVIDYLRRSGGQNQNFLIRLSTEIRSLTDGHLELDTLSKIYHVRITIYNEQMEEIAHFGKNKIPIDIKFYFMTGNIYPDKIDALYKRK